VCPKGRKLELSNRKTKRQSRVQSEKPPGKPTEQTAWNGWKNQDQKKQSSGKGKVRLGAKLKPRAM